MARRRGSAMALRARSTPDSCSTYLRKCLLHLADQPTRPMTSSGVAGPSWITWPSRSAMQRSTRSTKVGSWVATMRAGTVGVELVEDREQRRLAGGVEADEGLVDEQQLEGPHEAEGDRRALAEAAAEPGGQVVGAVAEPDPVEELVDVGIVDGHAVQRGDVREVLAHGQVVVEHGVVGEVAHRRPRREEPAGSPSTVISPSLSSRRPATRARKVDLPEPLCPTSATDWPRGTSSGERVERHQVAVGLGRVGRRRGSARRARQPLGTGPAPSAARTTPRSPRGRAPSRTRATNTAATPSVAVTAGPSAGRPLDRPTAASSTGSVPITARAGGHARPERQPHALRLRRGHRPAPAGGRRAREDAHHRTGRRAERHRHAGHRRHRRRQRVAARAPRPRSAAIAATSAWADHAHRHVAEVDEPGIERRRVAAARVVDLLRQRLDRVETGDEHGHARRARRAASSRPRCRGGPARRSPPSSTRRASRAAGQRSRPCRPRASTGNRPPGRDRTRIHGRSRGSSRASCRRSTTTVRRSCMVAAKRSWPTRCDRRSAASSEVWPSRARPTATSRIASPIGTRPRADHSSGQSTSSPKGSPGPHPMAPSPLATLRPTSTTPSTVAIQGRRCSPLATNAAPAASVTSVAPASAPVPIQAAVAPRCGGARADRRWPR